MVWRAVARVDISGDLWTWTTLCSCFGSISFAVSDGILGLKEFGLMTDMLSSSQCQLLVMLTYYAAQVGIALSVVDRKAMALLSTQSDVKRDQNDQREHKTKWNDEQSWWQGIQIDYKYLINHDIPYYCHSFQYWILCQRYKQNHFYYFYLFFQIFIFV